MTDREINLIVIVSLILSLILLLIVKPEATVVQLRGWINDIYFKDNEYLIKLKTCNYTEIVFDEALLYSLYEKEGKYVTIIGELKDNRIYLKEIK